MWGWNSLLESECFRWQKGAYPHTVIVVIESVRAECLCAYVHVNGESLQLQSSFVDPLYSFLLTNAWQCCHNLQRKHNV